MKGCLITTLIIISIVFIIGVLASPDTSDPYGTSVKSYPCEDIYAKNLVVNELKDYLKDSKSYDEISYSSKEVSEHKYEVVIKYRAKNSFGAYTIGQASAILEFRPNNMYNVRFSSYE